MTVLKTILQNNYSMYTWVICVTRFWHNLSNWSFLYSMQSVKISLVVLEKKKKMLSTSQTDDRQNVITKAHLRFQCRWAKSIYAKFLWINVLNFRTRKRHSLTSSCVPSGIMMIDPLLTGISLDWIVPPKQDIKSFTSAEKKINFVSSWNAKGIIFK